MKFAKMIFAAFAFLALSTAFATKAHAQTSTVYYSYTGTSAGHDFVVISGAKSELNVDGNWGASQSTAPNCPGSAKLCSAKVETFSGSAPSKATVIQKIQDDYNDSVIPHSFTSNPIEVRDGLGNLLYKITLAFKD